MINLSRLIKDITLEKDLIKLLKQNLNHIASLYYDNYLIFIFHIPSFTPFSFGLIRTKLTDENGNNKLDLIYQNTIPSLLKQYIIHYLQEILSHVEVFSTLEPFKVNPELRKQIEEYEFLEKINSSLKIH